MPEVTDLKDELWRQLRAVRARLVETLDGLPEYDLRRPLTPSGTNLLGLVKHLSGEEYGYLGEAFGRPPERRPTWFRDDPYDEIDLWATPEETSGYVLGVYAEACAHADATVAALDLDSPGRVAHWPEHPDTTLGVLLVRMTLETAQHLGHAEIVRELVDGRLSSGEVAAGASWAERRAAVQNAADAFRGSMPR